MSQLMKIMARVLNVTEEEFVEWHKQNEQKKTEEKLTVSAVERKHYQEAENPAPIPPDILDQFPTDEVVRLTKTNINKIIFWSTSRWNPWKKSTVINQIYELAREKKDCIKDWYCGRYSAQSDGSGWEYRLIVHNGTVKLIAFNHPKYKKRRVVFELV